MTSQAAAVGEDAPGPAAWRLPASVPQSTSKVPPCDPRVPWGLYLGSRSSPSWEGVPVVLPATCLLITQERSGRLWAQQENHLRRVLVAPAQSFTVCVWEPGPLLPTSPRLGTEPGAGGPLGLQLNDGRGSHLRPRAGGASAGTLLRDPPAGSIPVLGWVTRSTMFLERKGKNHRQNKL